MCVDIWWLHETQHDACIMCVIASPSSSHLISSSHHNMWLSVVKKNNLLAKVFLRKTNFFIWDQICTTIDTFQNTGTTLVKIWALFFEQSLWTVTLPLQFKNSNLVCQIWILNASWCPPRNVRHDRPLDRPYLTIEHLNSTRSHNWSPQQNNSPHFR